MYQMQANRLPLRLDQDIDMFVMEIHAGPEEGNTSNACSNSDLLYYSIMLVCHD